MAFHQEVFPRDKYLSFLTELFDRQATVYWKGSKEPFSTPVGGDDTSLVVKLDVGDAYGYGTSERRSQWVPEAMNGQGAFQYFTLQRMTWPLTIDVETLDADEPGEDFLMVVRNKLRWASSILAIQQMGLTTVRVGNVNSVIRITDDHESFGAVLELTHGQCFTLTETDDDGNIIETTSVGPGTLTDGVPDPLNVPGS